jgi:hypothetical protein
MPSQFPHWSSKPLTSKPSLSAKAASFCKKSILIGPPTVSKTCVKNRKSLQDKEIGSVQNTAGTLCEIWNGVPEA